MTLPSTTDPTATGLILHEELLPAAAAWSSPLRRGHALRLIAHAPGANVSLLAFNLRDLADRYNMADTLKGQHTARLSAGCILVSDMGRAMLSITSDTLGWHDPVGGHDNATLVRRKWGEKNYQSARNDCHRNSRDHFLVELAKHGLCARDLVSNVNFFSKVSADVDGRLHFHPDHSRAGDFVDLRAEIDLLVILTTCHHPMDTRPEYGPAPVRLQIHSVPPPDADDPCRSSRPENERAFQNSARFCL